MNDMIERVAKAIHSKQYNSTTSPYGDPADQKTKWSKVLARAAIEAMREPTEEMLATAFKTYNAKHLIALSYKKPWRAMIDAALKQE